MGCGAHVKSLVRISIGKFSLKEAGAPDAEEPHLVSLVHLAEHFPRISVDGRDARSFVSGKSILLGHAEFVARGIALMKGMVCVEGEKFLGFGTYAGYDYVRPVVIVPKC